MSKQKHIDHWLASADKDWDVLLHLIKGKKYVHALFFGHLYLEKLSKALWVQNNSENHPPRTHNLLKLLNEANVSLGENDQLFLLKLNKYQIEGRYPEDIEKLYAITHKELATEYIKTIKQLQLWLRKQLR
ncbi:MAG: HEPN domain-containing protein [Bacteroidetes bacterium]|nr:HEPN domain-containing protein [Bacteroidota bacterium]